MGITLAASARNASANGVVDLVDAGSGPGTIEVRTGAKPTHPADAATGTLLLTFTLNDPGFGNASSGAAALVASPAVSAVGVAAGTAGWFRVKDSTGAAVLDGTCGTDGSSDLILDTTTVSVGLTVTIQSGGYTQPEG